MNMDNKLTGSFYTPQKLIEYMAKYISGRITPRSILEPSAGDGRFVPAISIFDCPITAVELYKEKADALHMHCGEKCEIICADFLSYALETEKKYDFIIGNPPYISKKSLPECQRNLSLKLVEHFKLDEALFQNIWVSFILASLKVLSPNGSIFFVLPFEFLQVQYAERLREFLETKFNTIEITTFEDCIFPEIEQDVCLVYLSNEKIEKAYIKYTTLENAESAKPTFESVIMRNKPLKKWSNCILNDTETDELMRLSDMFAKIGSFGDISPGIVTGANSFFILSKQNIDKLNLNVKHQLSIISKSSLIPSLLTFKPEDFMLLSGTKNRTRLLDLTGLKETEFSNELKAYLLSGEKKDIHNRYKCKKRHRWYDVPIVKKGDVCFFKRFHYLPKIIINSADVHTTDIAYNIRIKDKYDPSSFAFCFYNSLTLALCEYNGRFYGGGVGELVPNEFKSLAIPYKKVTKEQLQQLDNMFRSETPFSDIIDYVDTVVLGSLSDNEIKLLQNVRNRYLTRRLKLYERDEHDGQYE